VQVPVALGNVALSLVLALGMGLGPLGFALGNTAALIAKNVALLVWLARRPDPAIPPAGRLLAPLGTSLLGAIPGLAALYFARPLYAHGLVQVMVAGALGGALALVGAALATLRVDGVRRLIGTVMRSVRPAPGGSSDR